MDSGQAWHIAAAFERTLGFVCLIGGELPVNVPGRSSPALVRLTQPGRRGSHLQRLAAVAFLALAAILTACGGNSSSTGAPAQATSAPVTSTPSGGQASACVLVSASGLSSLGLTGPGVPATVTAGTATTYGCTWMHPAGLELHLQYESVDPAAATQVRRTFGGQGVVVPGIGDGARGQFGSVLLAVNFYKGDTFVSMALFGTGVGGRKAAFLTVAKDVASHL
jgi:hypothetical protein